MNLGNKLAIKNINPQELLAKLKQQLAGVVQDRNKLILLIVIIAVFVYFDFAFFVGAQRRAIKAINPKIINIRKGLQNLQSDLIVMQRQGADSVVELKGLIASDETTWLIEEISRLANEQEVRISQIRPVLEGAVKPVADRKSNIKQFSPILIELEAIAGYHQLGRFLAELENYHIFLEVVEMDIRRIDSSRLDREIELRLKTYVAD